MSNQQTNETRTRQTLSRKSSLKPSEKAGGVEADRSATSEAAPETLVPEIVRARLHRVADETPTADRESRIAARAYDLASRRGFTPGNELADWLQAEKEIDAESPLQPQEQFTG